MVFSPQTHTLYVLAPVCEQNDTILAQILAQNPQIEAEGRLTKTHIKNENDILPDVGSSEQPTYFGEEYYCLEIPNELFTPQIVRNVIGLITYYPFDLYKMKEIFY